MNSIECENSKKAASTIGMGEFFDFLKIACQLNDVIINQNNHNENRNNEEIFDFEKLANNPLINRLLLEQNLKEQGNKGIECSTSTADDNNPKCGDDGAEDEKSRQKSLLSLSSSKLKMIDSIQHCHKLNVHPALIAKLEEVLNEGLLDPVIPYICSPAKCRNSKINCKNSNNSSCTRSGSGNQLLNRNNKSKNCDINSSGSNVTVKSSTSSNVDSEKKDTTSAEKTSASASTNSRNNDSHSQRTKDSAKTLKRKSVGNIQTNIEDKTMDTEITIHVCDEIKNISKDFTCSQNLLIDKMGYFADVTAGQKLEDMDISVHCDIQIFEWLMKWVKKDSLNTNQLENNNDNEPQLDVKNVIPILVSASFLKMEPLLSDCLTFCHSKLSEIIRTSTNLSCLNDSIITRLSAMFTNLELEMVKDKKERITPRLWTKMIQSLCEPEPQALRGHYFGIGGLFRCNKCGKYLTQSASSYITCIPSNMHLDRWGQLISKHSRDTSWQLTNYIGVLFKELKSWRKVYWKLWGHCHYVYCCICEMHFPLYQMNWCQYHPEEPQFLGPESEGKIAGPVGRYPCCGQQAFRYEPLPGPNGCLYREHSVVVECDRDKAILTLAQIAADGGCVYDPSPSKLPANSDYKPLCEGIQLIPKHRPGLLPTLTTEDHNSRISRRFRQAAARLIDSSSETDNSDNVDGKSKSTNWHVSSSSDGCESECSSSSSQFGRKGHSMKQIKMNGGRYWCGEMSARSNQDNQRDFEEKIMKQVITMVNKKIGSDTIVSSSKNHPGGTYIRLETEWREQLKQKNFTKQKTNK